MLQMMLLLLYEMSIDGDKLLLLMRKIIIEKIRKMNKQCVFIFGYGYYLYYSFIFISLLMLVAYLKELSVNL